jgi:hypothetical protein
MKRGLHMTIQDYVAHQRKHVFLPNAGVEGQRAMPDATANFAPKHSLALSH